MADDSGLSGEEIAKRYLAADAASGASVPSTSSTGSASSDAPALSGEDIAKRYIAADAAAAKTPAAASSASSSGAAKPAVPFASYTGIPTVDNLLAGASQGARDVVSTGANVAKWVDDRVPALNWLDQTAHINPGTTKTALDADRAAYEASPQGESTAGGVGRFLGGALTTAPILGGTGKLIGAAGNALVDGASSVAPWLGRGVNALGDMLSGSASAPSAGPVVNTAVKGVSRAIQGAGVGGAYGAATSGGSDQPVGDSILSGAAGGAVLGPAVGGVLDAATPSVAPVIANLAKLARDKYGINIPAPLMSENSLVRSSYDQSGKLPFSGAGPARAELDAQWHRAYDKAMGGEGSATFAAPDTMAANVKRITGDMNGVANRTTIDTNTDPHLLNQLADIQARAHSGQIPLAQGGLKSIDANIDSVIQSAAAGNGKIPGDIYQKMTMTNSPLDRAASAGPDVHTQNFNQEIMDALDQAHERAASPEDQAILNKARYQYRVMKTVEPLAAKSTDGTISPASLMTNATAQSRRFDPSTGGIAYTGGGDVGDLARIGKQFMSAPANSTTADRMIINGLMTGGGLVHGGAAALGAVNPLSLAAIPAGLGANRLAQTLLRSRGLANRAINNALTP